MPDAELVASTVENVRVVVRVRPMDQREKIDGSYNCVSVDPVNSTIAVTRSNASPPEPPRIYAYDAVFDSDTSQANNSQNHFFTYSLDSKFRWILKKKEDCRVNTLVLSALRLDWRCAMLQSCRMVGWLIVLASEKTSK